MRCVSMFPALHRRGVASRDMFGSLADAPFSAAVAVLSLASLRW